VAEKTLAADDLRQFIGTEHWYRHGAVPEILYTDGAKYLADRGQAYWLLDEIALAQRSQPAAAGEAFQLWTLAVNPDRTATLSFGDGNGRTVFSKAIKFTDFPLPEIALYVVDNVIMLPSEY
jgi:hypothetical protein